MAIASASLIIPATVYDTVRKSQSLDSQNIILTLSRGTAIVLLMLYLVYLVFQLKTHANLFGEERQLIDENEDNAQVLRPWAAGLTILVVTAVIAVSAFYLVGSINSFVEDTHISKTFVGFILIPIVGNAAEHVNAVIIAWKNKMELAIAVAIGSCLQTALFVSSFLVLLGSIMDRKMTLSFGLFETVTFFLSAYFVTLLIQDGKSNYLEGALCLGM
jgi:Ca2+:H+ antiporter